MVSQTVTFFETANICIPVKNTRAVVSCVGELSVVFQLVSAVKNCHSGFVIN